LFILWTLLKALCYLAFFFFYDIILSRIARPKEAPLLYVCLAFAPLNRVSLRLPFALEHGCACVADLAFWKDLLDRPKKAVL
jgi:hypothetical protein